MTLKTFSDKAKTFTFTYEFKDLEYCYGSRSRATGIYDWDL